MPVISTQTMVHREVKVIKDDHGAGRFDLAAALAGENRRRAECWPEDDHYVVELEDGLEEYPQELVADADSALHLGLEWVAAAIR